MNEPRSLPTQRNQLEALPEQRPWLQVLITMAASPTRCRSMDSVGRRACS